MFFVAQLSLLLFMGFLAEQQLGSLITYEQTNNKTIAFYVSFYPNCITPILYIYLCHRLCVAPNHFMCIFLHFPGALSQYLGFKNRVGAILVGHVFFGANACTKSGIHF